ncbi:serine/threonine-protein kinase [Streptomyces aidingensis]|uniref:Serine/threonine protein kinase n=1 Tax=Streptomyces aidingensis TaxID=910347 RepID=A0A1I1LFS9_9ACTN|nr:serine/threonine-protein kinase [Streptomyces aidingensis]SFC69868.1 Serine/threonine protein kinase [Streptomyces aidingensis]
MQPLTEDDPRQVGGYRLLAVLGEGGMGRVYLGRSAGGRTVAVKLVHAGMARDPGFRRRFAREVAASRAVSGPGTVPVVAADPEADRPWLASAYVSGPSLGEAVAAYGPLPEPALWRLAAALGEALGTVHAGGLVHRDLKPTNVLLAADGPLLIDFGIARAADDTALTGTGLVIGSPGYMSPEQAEGREVTPAADVFALGVVLAFAATGRGPFGSGSGPELLYRVVHHDPDLTEVPERFAAVLRRCLAKDPVDRPEPAELADWAAGQGGRTEDWLPAPIVSAIARKAEQLLNLEADAAAEERPQPPPSEARTEVTGPPALPPTAIAPPLPGSPAVPPTPVPGQFPPYHTPRLPPGPQPQYVNPYAAPPRPWPAVPGGPVRPMPQADPRRRVWIAPWVQGKGLGRPLLALWGLIPLAVLFLVRDAAAELAVRHPAPSGEWADSAELVRWAVEDRGAPLVLVVPLAVAMAFLQSFRGGLYRRPAGAVRAWTALGAAFWMLWCLVIWTGVVWALGIVTALDEDAVREPDAGVFAVFGLAALALAAVGLAAVGVFFAALARLIRGLAGDVARPAAP